MLRRRGSNRQWGTFWSSNLVPPKWILGHSNTEFKYCTRYWTTSTKEKETEGTLRLEIFIPLRVWKGINFSRLVSEGEMKKGIWLTPSLQNATTANRSLYLQMVNLVWVVPSLRERPYMTTAKFSGFWTRSPPCPHLGLIYSTKFTQPPLLNLLWG